MNANARWVAAAISRPAADGAIWVAASKSDGARYLYRTTTREDGMRWLRELTGLDVE